MVVGHAILASSMVKRELILYMYVYCIYSYSPVFSLGGMQSKPNGSLEYIILVLVCLLLSFDVYSSTVRFKLNFGQELCSFHRLKGLLSCVFLIWMVFSTFFVCCIFGVVLYFGISFKDFRFVRHITCWFLISLYFLV